MRTPARLSSEAILRVDGGGVFTPAISQFGAGTQAVGTPAIDSSWTSDVYLTIDSIPDGGGSWTFGVVVQPMVTWLWIGGGLMAIGSVLSAVPGRRRRPTDPVSASLEPAFPRPDETPDHEDLVGDDRTPAGAARPELPVGAGETP